MAEARFYIRLAKGILGDRKMAGLTDGERWAWAAILIMADDAKPAGTLTESPDDLAFRARVDPENMRGAIDKLTAMVRPPLVRNSDGSLTVTKWADHQGARFPSAENDAVAARVRESRARNKENRDNRDTPDVTNVTNVTNGNDVTSVTTLIHPITSHYIPDKVVETCEVVGGVGDFSQSKPLAASPPTTKPISRKTRIPEGFQPSEADIAKAMQDHGCSRRDLDSETAAFMEFFLPGGEGETTVHRYWSSAWFRWMRTTRWSSRSKPSSNGAAPANEERMVLDSRIAELSDKIHIGEMKCSHLEPDNLMHTKLAALVAERDTLADRRAAL